MAHGRVQRITIKREMNDSMRSVCCELENAEINLVVVCECK